MKNTIADTNFIITGGEFPPLPETFLTGILLDTLPSINDILYLSPHVRADVLREERQRGYETALNLAKFFKWELVTVKNPKQATNLRDAYKTIWKRRLTTKRVFCFVRVFRLCKKGDLLTGVRERDVYNVCVKAFVDGFTDAGVWIDDNEKYHTDIWIHFAGFVEDNPRMEIEFWEAKD